MYLQGKVALITGAAQGLGKVFTKALLNKGVKVCLVDANKKLGDETSKEISREFGNDAAQFVPCDVTKSQDLENVFTRAKEQFGRLDIVCNNAGIVDEMDWRRSIDINLTSVIHGTMLGMEYMRQDKGNAGGVIINVASVAALFHVPYAPVYAASKAGVVAFSKSWGCNPDFLAQGVRVNCLCPAYARTAILDMNDKIYSDHLAKANIKALGIMQPEDVLEGFMKLTEDPDLTAAVVRVTRKGCTILEKGIPKWMENV